VAAQSLSTLMSCAADAVNVARRLASTPSYTLGVVITLALALGTNTAVFGVVRSTVLHPQVPWDGSVPMLRLDVVVTDEHGGAIRGLRAADFSIREDGTARPVETAEFRWIPSDYFGVGTPILTRADEEREARQPGTRVFAFLLDREHHVRRHWSAAIRTSCQPPANAW